MAKMASKRFFVNTLLDYQNKGVASYLEDWRLKALEMLSYIVAKQRIEPKDADGGLYVGLGGIGYMFFHLSQSSTFANEASDFISKGLQYIGIAEQYYAFMMKNSHKIDKSDKCSFLLGQAGILAVSAALHRAAGNNGLAEQRLREYAAVATLCKPIDFLEFGGDELFVGRAGYLCGANWLRSVFNKRVISAKDTTDLCHSILESGKRYSQSHRSPCPLMFAYYQTEYLGAAHGLCSILQMLLSCEELPRTEREELRTSIDFLLSLQQADGNFPCSMEDVGRRSSGGEELVHWCHGAPGMIYLMAKAYLLWEDEKYLTCCLRCGDLVWNKGLLRKGPGICHGVAGNGYVFLLLYRLTDDPKHLHRANAFAKFLFTDEFKSSRVPDSPYSLFEGTAGTVCFLTDLTTPNQATFPFMNIF